MHPWVCSRPAAGTVSETPGLAPPHPGEAALPTLGSLDPLTQWALILGNLGI